MTEKSLPLVLILTPVKDAGLYLERYFNLLLSMEYDYSRLSLGLLESDSRDNSWEQLKHCVPQISHLFHRTNLLQHSFNFFMDRPRWSPEIQRQRREVLARSRNRLWRSCLKKEEYILWLDCDLESYPRDLLLQLLDTGKDIVVPHCRLPGGATFDLNTFIFHPERHMSERDTFIRDGIYQPPKGKGRRYLDSCRDNDLVKVDGVGGTALLIKADLFREGLLFPESPYQGYIETEGLAIMAKNNGVSSWGMPNLHIVHTNA